MKKEVFLLLFLWISFFLYAQEYPQATKDKIVQEAFLQKQKLRQQSLIDDLKMRSVGPSVMSGRVSDIDANPDNPNEFYVAYASGGLWYTKNMGMSFIPLFDHEAVMTIGDIAVDWKHGKTLWLGSGEVNSSRSSYAGNGIYKSIDGGKSWVNTGLTESQHIGRIIIHPNNPDIVWVAALGHLYSQNKERGIFKTTDGGKTWEKKLFVNDSTGAVDLIIDPKNPNILYAAMWQRDRKAWNFIENGKGSGIYKSTDGGENWTKISIVRSGFPDGVNVGRIGLAISKQNSNIIYAILDNQAPRKKEKQTDIKGKLTKSQLREMSKPDFLKLDNKLINNYLSDNKFPKEYKADTIKELVKTDKIKVIALVEYLEDANADLFETPPIGAEVYRSEDGGINWKKTFMKYLDDVYYTYGYYFGQIRVSPFNDNEIYIMGVPLLNSVDTGKTWNTLEADNVHGDHHALWLSAKTKGLLLNGNDGGLNLSYDDGQHWQKINIPNVGQFYSVNFDLSKPYNVYGGLQDNGVWKGPSNYIASMGWQSSGHYPYKMILGGDGMQVQVDTRDNETVYAGYQFGHYYRINTRTEDLKYFHPKHKLGERPLRFNWETPILLSKHNQDILYMGSNKFHRSMNQGNDFETLSEDLTKGGKKGNVAYGTLTCIEESPLQFGLLYVGTDDGLVQISKDGGYSWNKIIKGLPENLWVSSICVSKFKKSRVYMSLNAYRWDNFNAYLYVSDDFGQNWKQIGLKLPSEPINVVIEDPENENLIFVGSDHGVYASLNGGNNFMPFIDNFPAVPVHDLKVQPKKHDLIAGTHGRSIYIADIQPLEQLDSTTLNRALIVFDIKPISWSSRWGNNSFNSKKKTFDQLFKFTLYSKNLAKADIKIKTEKGLVLNSFSSNLKRGLNFISYNLTLDKKVLKKYQNELNKNKKLKEVELKKRGNGNYYLYKGKYDIEVVVNGEIFKNKLIIE